MPDPLLSSCYELMCPMPALCCRGEAMTQKYPYFQHYSSKTCIGYLRRNFIHDSIALVLNLRRSSKAGPAPRSIMPYRARPRPHIECKSSRSPLWRLPDKLANFRSNWPYPTPNYFRAKDVYVASVFSPTFRVPTEP